MESNDPDPIRKATTVPYNFNQLAQTTRLTCACCGWRWATEDDLDDHLAYMAHSS